MVAPLLKSALRSYESELAELERAGRKRFLRTVAGSQQAHIELDGRPVLLLCSNNYLGLAGHPRLRQAAAAAAAEDGCSSGASRLISGTMTLHDSLEKELADFKKSPSSLVFNSGYVANLAILTTLAGKGDVIYSDALNHASIVDGCRLSRAELKIYRHCDCAHLEEMLRSGGQTAGRRLIVTDSVFSMDGDLAPLPEIVALGRKYDALVVVDDAHATGVLGRSGRGATEYFGLDWRDLDVQMGTLGKALGSYGAYVAGAPVLREYLLNRARSFIYTTALPPAVLAASRAALAVLRDEPQRLEKLRQLGAFFREELRKLGFRVTDDPTPIIPVLVGPAAKTMELSAWFLEKGVFIQGIRPPTVPEGASRLRVTLSADLEFADLDRVLALFAERRRDFI
ncbi:MAG: 8-amino-7-oxononanoate synthase [Deltaproteobacteria bacterium]|nr:8-amino-7-oxononanoate synthase [Deltaproteobacteria bacterium]